MNFSNETLQKAMSVFPDFTDLHEYIRMGDEVAITMVSQLSEETFTPFEIIAAFDNKEKLNNLYSKAKRAAEKIDLYSLMLEDYHGKKQ